MQTVTVPAAARALGVSQSKVRRWITSGQLLATKGAPGGRWQIDADTLQAFADTHQLPAVPSTPAPFDRWPTLDQAAIQLRSTRDAAARWLRAGLLTGDRSTGRWLIDPTSVLQMQARLAAASWWRQDGHPRHQSTAARKRATTAVLDAARAWRHDPHNEQLIAALATAIDHRDTLTTRDRGPGQAASAPPS